MDWALGIFSDGIFGNVARNFGRLVRFLGNVRICFDGILVL